MRYNTILILILLCVLVCFVLCERNKHLHKKKEHHGHHDDKRKIGSKSKHGFRKTKRVPLRIELQLKDNKIRGSVKETDTNGTRYYLFQGIPYAKPPVGNLRFEPPQPYKWNGTYDATYQRSICTQNTFPNGFDVQGSEDCLYLNVYSPISALSSSAPVMVWIHGGAFLYGSGNYELFAPDNFIDQNVVFVSFNYRLGVFGFLSTGDAVAPGNMGLKDQALALRWVQENIEHFGGDPRNVTIMGESAGAASVTYLVQSPATEGLFHRAIAHSGNTLCPWALSRRAAANTALLANKNLIFTRNTTDIVKRLKRINYRRLSVTSVSSMTVILVLDPLNGLVYTPVIEPTNPNEFFSTRSYEQLDSCNLRAVPMIIGYNSEEAKGADQMLGLLRFYLARYDLDPRGLVPLDMNVNGSANLSRVGNEIRDTYFGNSSVISNGEGLVKYISHDQFVRPTIQYSKLYSDCGQNVYQYRFAYTQNGAEDGLGHAQELDYFFYHRNLTGEQNLKFSANVVKIWTNFIKTGDPTPDYDEFNVTWVPTIKENDYSYLDIGTEFVNYNQSGNPEKSYLDKWTNWYDTYGNNLYDTY